jgi:hypothetical protein
MLREHGNCAVVKRGRGVRGRGRIFASITAPNSCSRQRHRARHRGMITDVERMLKPRQPSLGVVAVELEDSAVLSGGKPGAHKIQGIGAGFIPDVLDRSVIDEMSVITFVEGGPMQIHSPAFSDGAGIPRRYTCDG